MKKILEILKRNKFIIFLIGLLVLKILLVEVQPISAKYSMKYDDQLMINMANNILEGNWLGEYNSFTLIKGVFTPLFIALTHIFNIPFLIGKEIFYGIACILFILIIKKKVKNELILSIIYIVVLLNPIEYCSSLCRAYRDTIYISLILYLFSFLIAIFLNRNENTKVQIKYYIGMGISFVATYLCREETIWLLPFILFITIATIIPNVITKKKIDKKILLYLIPICISLISINVICLLNYKYYGDYTLNQYWGKDFKSAYGALTRIIPEKEIRRVPVTSNTMNKLYDLSPKFAELEEFFEGKKGNGWELCGEKIKNEINGGYFHWALMDAVESKGYYKDAKTANQFYRDLANEINEVCDNKVVISRERKRISNTCYFNLNDIIYVITKMPTTMKYQYTLKDVKMIVSNSKGILNIQDGERKKELMENMTGQEIVTSDHYNSKENKTRLEIINIIEKIYSYINPHIFYISILVFIGIVLLNIKKIKTIYEELVILISLLILYLSRIFVVTFTSELMFLEAKNVEYLSSIYNIQYLFSIFTIIFFTNSVINKIGEKNGKRVNNINTSIK